ncbi:hypothetical protein [Nostoc linckia]|nr:hypothetical protein [Nostoc linckia]
MKLSNANLRITKQQEVADNFYKIKLIDAEINSNSENCLARQSE